MERLFDLLLREFEFLSKASDPVTWVTHLFICLVPCLLLHLIHPGVSYSAALLLLIIFSFREGNHYKGRWRDTLGDLAGPLLNYLVFSQALFG